MWTADKWKDYEVLDASAGEKLELTVEADVDWTVAGVPEWLALTPSAGEAGATTVTLEVMAENESAQEREAELVFTSPSDAAVKAVLKVRQQSNLILPPSGLGRGGRRGPRGASLGCPAGGRSRAGRRLRGYGQPERVDHRERAGRTGLDVAGRCPQL